MEKLINLSSRQTLRGRADIASSSLPSSSSGETRVIALFRAIEDAAGAQRQAGDANSLGDPTPSDVLLSYTRDIFRLGRPGHILTKRNLIAM